MQSIDEYYKARYRVYLTTALLLTWDFFAKTLEPNVDFEFLKFSISTEAIPFLLSLLVVFSFYNMVFHWKLITNSEKNILSERDYYATVVFCMICLTISFMHQVNKSNSELFLLDALGFESGFVFGSIILIISMVSKNKLKKDILNMSDEQRKIFLNSNKKFSKILLNNISFYSELSIVIVCFVGLLNLAISGNEYFKLSFYEAAYFFTFQIVYFLLLMWALY